jgi:opacity protein-like surface antigen
MNKLAGLLGLAVALIASSPALANGYGQRNVPAPIPVPAPVPIPEGFTYYLRGDIGWGFAGDPSFSESGAQYGLVPLSYGALSGRGASTDDVFFGGIGAGGYFTPHLRGDITLDFRGAREINAIATYTDAGPIAGTARETIELRSTVGLINVYWDLLPRGSFSPYVGAGVGFVYNDIERTHLTTEVPGGVASSGSSGDTNFGLAAALMAGVTIARDHAWALDVGYRALYMDGGEVTTTLSNGDVSRVDIGSQWEHQVRVGLRVNLW